MTFPIISYTNAKRSNLPRREGYGNPSEWAKPNFCQTSTTAKVGVDVEQICNYLCVLLLWRGKTWLFRVRFRQGLHHWKATIFLLHFKPPRLFVFFTICSYLIWRPKFRKKAVLLNLEAPISTKFCIQARLFLVLRFIIGLIYFGHINSLGWGRGLHSDTSHARASSILEHFDIHCILSK